MTYSQQDTMSLQLLDKNHLLSKSKTQKTAGWIITATGLPVALFTGYMLVGWPSDVFDRGTTAIVFAGSGLYTLTGILLISAGKKNKQKALSISFLNNKVLTPHLTTMRWQMQPAVSLRIVLH